MSRQCPMGGRLAEDFAGQPVGKPGGDQPAQKSPGAHREFDVAHQADKQPDDPRHHQGMVQIPDIQVLGIIPVIGFLEKEFRHPQVQESQQDGVDDDCQAKPVPPAFGGPGLRASGVHEPEIPAKKCEHRKNRCDEMRNRGGNSEDLHQRGQQPAMQEKRQQGNRGDGRQLRRPQGTQPHLSSANAPRNCRSTASAVMTCRQTLSVQGVLRWLAALTQGEQARPA